MTAVKSVLRILRGVDVDLDVDVSHTAAVPTGVDRVECRQAVAVSELDAAEKCHSGSTLSGEARIDTLRVAVPNVNSSPLDRLARGGVNYGNFQRQWHSFVTLAGCSRQQG